MPIKASAKKAVRQGARRRTENLIRMEAYKKAIKKFKKFAEAKDANGAKNALNDVYQTLDKAAKTNVIPSNKAARLKSRLTKKLEILK